MSNMSNVPRRTCRLGLRAVAARTAAGEPIRFYVSESAVRPSELRYEPGQVVICQPGSATVLIPPSGGVRPRCLSSWKGR